MKTLTILAVAVPVALVALAACTPSANEDTTSWTIPEGLKDCKIFRMSDSVGTVLYVMRCPNSATASRIGGKQPKRAVVIDGVTYEEKE
jgi:hypothetical protein